VRYEPAEGASKPADGHICDKWHAVRPQSEGWLLALSGVGPVKLERYGTAFLEELREGSGH